MFEDEDIDKRKLESDAAHEGFYYKGGIDLSKLNFQILRVACDLSHFYLIKHLVNPELTKEEYKAN